MSQNALMQQMQELTSERERPVAELVRMLEGEWLMKQLGKYFDGTIPEQLKLEVKLMRALAGRWQNNGEAADERQAD